MSLSYIFPLTLIRSVAATSSSAANGSNSLLSESIVQSLNQLSTGPPAQPSVRALESHIDDLEMDVKNAEFRLQFLYNQRKASIELLVNAKRQLERLKR